jgi:hypothetical protein
MDAGCVIGRIGRSRRRVSGERSYFLVALVHTSVPALEARRTAVKATAMADQEGDRAWPGHSGESSATSARS